MCIFKCPNYGKGLNPNKIRVILDDWKLKIEKKFPDCKVRLPKQDTCYHRDLDIPVYGIKRTDNRAFMHFVNNIRRNDGLWFITFIPICRSPYSNND